MKRGLLDAKAKVADTRKDELGASLFSDLFMFAAGLVKKVLVAGAGLFLFTAPVYWLVPVHRALTLRGLVGVAIVVACGILVSEIVLARKRRSCHRNGTSYVSSTFFASICTEAREPLSPRTVTARPDEPQAP
jgi:hypothetical protein